MSRYGACPRIRLVRGQMSFRIVHQQQRPTELLVWSLGELRAQVYDHWFTPLVLHRQSRGGHFLTGYLRSKGELCLTCLRLCCKQIYNETNQAFFTSTTFAYTVFGNNQFYASPAFAVNIRHVRLTIYGGNHPNVAIDKAIGRAVRKLNDWCPSLLSLQLFCTATIFHNIKFIPTATIESFGNLAHSWLDRLQFSVRHRQPLPTPALFGICGIDASWETNHHSSGRVTFTLDCGKMRRGELEQSLPHGDTGKAVQDRGRFLLL